MKKEKMIIIGQSGSGKDFLMRKMSDKGLKTCVKHTTRPLRVGEEQGLTYNYIDDLEFNEKINKDEFLIFEKFEVLSNNEKKVWFYGISKSEFKSSQVLIMTPSEFKSIELSIEDRKNCFVVLLDIERSIREKRLHHREDKNDSVKRRLDSDEIDFKEPIDFDLKITDPDFLSDDIYDLMY